MANTETTPAPSQKTAPPAKRWMWLINNQERVLGLSMPPVYSQQAKASTPDSNVFTLQPGANLVEIKRYEALKAADPDREVDGEVMKGEISRLLTTKIPRAAHKSRQAEAAGSFFLMEGPKVASNKAPLDGLTEAESLLVVEELRDVAMLRTLIKIEKRPTVNEALHRELDKLTKGLTATAA